MYLSVCLSVCVRIEEEGITYRYVAVVEEEGVTYKYVEKEGDTYKYVAVEFSHGHLEVRQALQQGNNSFRNMISINLIRVNILIS